MPTMRRVPTDMSGRTFDLLVIGGGINGTGIARDAARRGLSVALVEKEDLGYGTTGRSTRLIHGGLRYLAMYDFGLVRESLLERERLLENAPHLVRPITFLIPFYRGQRTAPWKLRIGLQMYDALAGASRVKPHRVYDAQEVLDLEPGMNPTGLTGGATYSDGQVEMVERLCVENALDAAAHGAVILNHAFVTGLTNEGPTTSADVEDTLSGGTFTVRAKWVVNTTGPWIDRSPGVGHVESRMTKGAHLVTPATTQHAVLLFSPDDDRVFFSIPWLGQQLVGTTDTDFRDAPDTVHADAADVTYLQRGIRQALPDSPVDDIHYTYAGIRNLVPEKGKGESAVSRKHLIIRHDADGYPRLITLVGGKITPYRAVSEEIVDMMARELRAPRSDTAHAPLPGAPRDADVHERGLEARAAALHLPPGVARSLARTYGTRADAILDRIAADPAGAELLCPHSPLLLAEVDFVIHEEMARTAADVLFRRVRSGWDACQGLDALPRVLDRLDAALGRSPEARKSDEAAYHEQIALRAAWRA